MRPYRPLYFEGQRLNTSVQDTPFTSRGASREDTSAGSSYLACQHPNNFFRSISSASGTARDTRASRPARFAEQYPDESIWRG